MRLPSGNSTVCEILRWSSVRRFTPIHLNFLRFLCCFSLSVLFLCKELLHSKAKLLGPAPKHRSAAKRSVMHSEHGTDIVQSFRAQSCNWRHDLQADNRNWYIHCQWGIVFSVTSGNYFSQIFYYLIISCFPDVCENFPLTTMANIRGLDGIQWGFASGSLEQKLPWKRWTKEIDR